MRVYRTFTPPLNEGNKFSTNKHEKNWQLKSLDYNNIVNLFMQWFLFYGCLLCDDAQLTATRYPNKWMDNKFVVSCTHTNRVFRAFYVSFKRRNFFDDALTQHNRLRMNYYGSEEKNHCDCCGRKSLFLTVRVEDISLQSLHGADKTISKHNVTSSNKLCYFCMQSGVSSYSTSIYVVLWFSGGFESLECPKWQQWIDDWTTHSWLIVCVAVLNTAIETNEHTHESYLVTAGWYEWHLHIAHQPHVMQCGVATEIPLRKYTVHFTAIWSNVTSKYKKKTLIFQRAFYS